MTRGGWLTAAAVPLVPGPDALLALPVPYLPGYHVPAGERLHVSRALEKQGYRSHALLLIACAGVLAAGARLLVPEQPELWTSAVFCLAVATAGLLCAVLAGRLVARARQLIWLHRRFPMADAAPGLRDYWRAQLRSCSTSQARRRARTCLAIALLFPLLALTQIGMPALLVAPFFLGAAIALLFGWKWWLLAQPAGKPR